MATGRTTACANSHKWQMLDIGVARVVINMQAELDASMRTVLEQNIEAAGSAKFDGVGRGGADLLW